MTARSTSSTEAIFSTSAIWMATSFMAPKMAFDTYPGCSLLKISGTWRMRLAKAASAAQWSPGTSRGAA